MSSLTSSMTSWSQRRVFTILMTLFATTFCAAITVQVLAGEADLIADVLKIAILISGSTAATSFGVWTLTHLKKDSVPRGMLAGVITTTLIIPLPAFVSNLKALTLAAYQSSTENFFSAFFSIIPTAVNAGLYTFIDITKASIIAVTASMVLGALIAVFISPKVEPPSF